MDDKWPDIHRWGLEQLYNIGEEADRQRQIDGPRAKIHESRNQLERAIAVRQGQQHLKYNGQLLWGLKVSLETFALPSVKIHTLRRSIAPRSSHSSNAVKCSPKKLLWTYSIFLDKRVSAKIHNKRDTYRLTMRSSWLKHASHARSHACQRACWCVGGI